MTEGQHAHPARAGPNVVQVGGSGDGGEGGGMPQRSRPQPQALLYSLAADLIQKSGEWLSAWHRLVRHLQQLAQLVPPPQGGG